MDPQVKSSMLEYYDDVAPGYDAVYSGQFPDAARLGAEVYVADTVALQDMVGRSSRGRLLDAPCGTAFWLPSYASQVEQAVLIDQSRQMLEQARQRAVANGIGEICTFVQGDVIEQAWEAESFETVLVGFFLSHVDEPEERRFFANVRRALRPGGCVLVFDSVWNGERASHKAKEGVVRRTVQGRPFDVYKRYFDAEDLVRMAEAHGFRASVSYEGRVFIAATLTHG